MAAVLLTVMSPDLRGMSSGRYIQKGTFGVWILAPSSGMQVVICMGLSCYVNDTAINCPDLAVAPN